VTYRHVATGDTVDAFMFGAGDTSVGMIFLGSTTTRAAEISDQQIVGCAWFAK
jgi:hypothetical protein